MITDATAQTARWEYEVERDGGAAGVEEKITSVKSTETAIKKHNAPVVVEKE